MAYGPEEMQINEATKHHRTVMSSPSLLLPDDLFSLCCTILLHRVELIVGLNEVLFHSLSSFSSLVSHLYLIVATSFSRVVSGLFFSFR